jgi:hypothetical protein
MLIGDVTGSIASVLHTFSFCRTSWASLLLPAQPPPPPQLLILSAVNVGEWMGLQDFGQRFGLRDSRM